MEDMENANLELIETYLSFFRYYLMYKQKYNIEIPATVCGNRGIFELVTVKLKDLWLLDKDDNKCRLIEHPCYRAIHEQNYDIYENWLPDKDKKIKKQWYSLNDYIELYEKIKNEGYRLDKSIIVIDNNNTIIDGWHRGSILCHLHGSDYEIKAIKIVPIQHRSFKYTNFERIFSVKNLPDEKHKVITILGIKLKFKRKDK